MSCLLSSTAEQRYRKPSMTVQFCQEAQTTLFSDSYGIIQQKICRKIRISRCRFPQEKGVRVPSAQQQVRG